MKVALCQSPMHWTLEENVDSILNWMEKAAEQKADLAVFSECAITGYHRKLPESIDAAKLKSAYEEILSAAIENNLSVIAGAPYIEKTAPNKIFNSAIYFDPKNKRYEVTSKIGLSATEQRFFTKGQKRKLFKVQGRNVGVIFCREINDKEEVLADYADRKLDLLLWPSYIKWDGDESIPDFIHQRDYLDVSRKIKVPIININSPNALNDDSITGIGGSLYLKEGNVLFKGALDKEMLKILEV